MSDETVKLLLEDEQGAVQESSCRRLAILWQGRELWIQPGDDGQLMIGVEDEPGADYANLVLRPHAANLVALGLEFEPADEDEGHVHGPDCGHAH